MLGGVFSKFGAGLGKTREAIRKKIAAVVSVGESLDEDTLEEIEAILIQADMGLDVSTSLVEDLRSVVKDQDKDPQTIEEVMKILERLVAEVVEVEKETLLPRGRGDFPAKPYVVLMVGVNGAGKTTTVGKLAKNYADAGNKVMVAACDTFRAGAVAQLDVWAGRAGVDIIRAQQGADPASVAYDAVQASLSRGIDVLLVDTAGRLQNKTNLMEELKKIQRSIGKQAPQAPHETLLVLDATNGQNALSQAREFNNVASLTGIVLTKLDGTAKGGIVVALRKELNLPVKMIGVGEGIEDLHPFDGKAFSHSLFIG